jgi:hypothetical protein
MASPAPAITVSAHPFHETLGIMHAASEGQPHGAKCLFLRGFQPQAAAQAPLAATIWSSHFPRI